MHYRAIMPAVLLALLGVMGCTYQSVVDVTPALDVYSSYDEEIPGTWALSINSDGFKDQIAEMEGFACSAHKFPVNPSSAFADSVTATLDNLVTDVHRVDNRLTTEALERSDYAGQINVKAESFDADLRVIVGFWSNDMKADVEMSASVTVSGGGERLLGKTLSGDGEHRTEQGLGCAGGSAAVGKATEVAMKELLQNLGEAFTNAPKVRNYSF